MASVLEIYNLTPKTNCRECGQATCMAFASALLARKVAVEDCPPLLEDKYAEQRAKLQELFAGVEGATETGLVIHEEKCFGCGNCVVACPVNVANDPYGVGSGRAPTNDKVILRIIDRTVHASNIEECRRFGPNRILCNACIAPCPLEAIEFVE